MKRRVVSIVLVLAMLLSMVPTSVFANIGNGTEPDQSEQSGDSSNLNNDANNDGKVSYVSLGASNTNGYGLDGYLPPEVHEDPLAASKADLNDYGYLMAPEAAYPAQIAEALGAELHQLAISSMRTEEVLFLLDENYKGDEYLDWRFYDSPEIPKVQSHENWFVIAGRKILGRNASDAEALKALRAQYQEYISKADYITIDLGWNNFGVFAFNNIKNILDRGYYYLAPDFTSVFNDEEMKEYEVLREKVRELLAEKGGINIAPEKLSQIVDVLVYTTMGATLHFDSVMEKIYELNPDVRVAVINIQNLADGLVVKFGEEDEGLELGDTYEELIDIANIYRATESPYADKYVFVDCGDVKTFMDEIIAWDGDPKSLTGDMEDCFDMYDDNLYVRSIVEYLMVGQALSRLFDGFRTMAAGYGLEVFKNDASYTYEFALN